MACSKTENASWTTDASAPPALASCAPRPLPLPSRAARAAWQTGHHWHSGASLGGGSLVAVSQTSPLSLRSAPRVRLTWPATWLAMLRAPAFISQRWKSATGSLLLGWPRPPPDWPLPPLLCWPDWGWLGLGIAVLGLGTAIRLGAAFRLALASGFRHLTPPTDDRTRLPLQDEWGAGGAEMAHVQAFRDADPRPAGQWLVHVPEDRVPRLGRLNHVEQRGAALLQPPGHGVVEKFRDGGRDVRAQHVHLTDRLDLGAELLVAYLVRGPVDRLQPAADEPEGPSVQFGRSAVKDVMPGFGEPLPHGGDVDVAVGQVRGLREGAEHLGVLPLHRGLEEAGPALRTGREQAE